MGFVLVYRRQFLAVLAYAYMFLMFLVSISMILIYIYISPPTYPVSEIFERELKILNTETWLTAIIMACLCLRLGYGGMIFLGSQNNFHNDLLTDAMIITVVVSFIYVSQAMLHVLVRDSFMLEALHGDYQTFSQTCTAAVIDVPGKLEL
ncbi:hypothetical protein OESDEN_16902 [Oesophagostomum dentatum]|uniref:Uncharacterized protein n=1 Tax=Oesophagostomum dentatum TaxID=61180 RepID=A0A0B1SHM5_OESDE|nr:hypothetical protein OESDEN_16902 [Oesophagostomum dentatum]